MPGQSPPGWPHESSPPSPGGSSCPCNRRASRPSAGTALSRAGSVACHAAGALLVAFAAVLALPLQAQAQSTLVSNLGQGNDSSADVNPPVAQRFTTGSNPGGYTLSRVEIKPEDSDSFSVSVCGVDEDGFPNLTDLYGVDCSGQFCVRHPCLQRSGRYHRFRKHDLHRGGHAGQQ